MRDKLKFLLVNPTAPQWQVTPGKKPRRSTKTFRFSMLPSLHVAASMPPDVETQIIDEDIEPINFDSDADIIGISFMTFNAPRAYEIADKFRKEKGKTVVFGGYHPTFMPDEAASHADAICIGEAEPNMPQIINDYRVGKLQKFYYNGLADLNKLPILNRDLIDKSQYITPWALQATRGCPNRCTFCSVSTFHQHNHRTRPIEAVLDELRCMGKYVLFMDDNLVGHHEYAKELFSRMIPLKKTWFGQGGINIAYDDELRQLAAASGCHGMFIGFESLSEDNLRDSHKRFNKSSEYKQIIKILHDSGIGVFAGFVFGMDNDRPDVFKTTLDFLHESGIDLLQATIQTPFPGTPLFDQMDKEGRIFCKDWSRYDFTQVVFEPNHMSRYTLKHGCDWVRSNFYSQPAIWRRVMRAFGCMSPLLAIACIGITNYNYRTRCVVNHIMESGKHFRV